MVFLPQEAASRHACVEEIERSVKAEGQVILGWREVPVNHEMPMSPTVKAKEPVIRQVFVGRGPDVFVTDALERKLFIIRRRAANAIKSLKLKHGQVVVAPSPKRQVPGRFFRSGKGDEVMNLTGGGRLERVQPTSLPAQDSEGRLPL
jgi:glutamate synthase domain-containing protein 1